MADIFISYAREDYGSIARIATALEAEGFSVWWDREIPVGQSWHEFIARNIQNAKASIVVWSPASITSEWVMEEATVSRSAGKYLPIRIDNAEPPFGFTRIQAANLTGWNGDRAHTQWQMLLRETRKLVSAPDGPASPPQHSKATSHATPGAVWRDIVPGLPSDACPEMVTIGRGKFQMGSRDSEDRWQLKHSGGRDEYDGREDPQHEVTIGYVFAMGKHLLTFAEWDAAIASGAKLPSINDNNWGRERRPVINVSWEDAGDYIDWLNTRLGLQGRPDAYRLPSEAEWEYACRAGTTTPFSTGSAISTSQANYNGHFVEAPAARTEFRAMTTPVGEFAANQFGLHDMHGNVREWCEDVWNRNYNGAPSDGSAWVKGRHSYRVIRGGSWFSDAQTLRSASRLADSPTARTRYLGFRLARTLGK